MNESTINTKHPHTRTLYVSDLDGTLLNRLGAISEKTTKGLNNLISKEHILFTVATARTPATVTDIMSKIHCNIPFIVMAGAGWWNNETCSYSHLRCIPNDIVVLLLPIFMHYKMHPFIYRIHDDNVLKVYHDKEFTHEEKEFIRPRIATKYKELIIDSDLASHTSQAIDPAVLLYTMGPYPILHQIADDIKRQHLHCSSFCYKDVYKPDIGILEIYSEGTDKARSITELADELKVDRVVVFGDNINDIPMFKNATVSLAVDNAIQEVKQQATEIIGTNADDGVIEWLKKDVERSHHKEKGRHKSISDNPVKAKWYLKLFALSFLGLVLLVGLLLWLLPVGNEDTHRFIITNAERIDEMHDEARTISSENEWIEGLFPFVGTALLSQTAMIR